MWAYQTSDVDFEDGDDNDDDDDQGDEDMDLHGRYTLLKKITTVLLLLFVCVA